jgi:hypothetical protein
MFGTSSVNTDEVSLDRCVLADLFEIYNQTPAIKVAREAFLSMTICAPFTFSIARMALRSNNAMSLVIERHWMPWQRTVFDWVKMLGLCPYYIRRAGDHPVPVVPPWGSGRIAVVFTKTREVQYRWYWEDKMTGPASTHDSRMLWVTTDYAPTIEGCVVSPVGSLLSQYRTIRVLQNALESAATQNAHLTHVLEYHPSAATATNDNLTQLMANFGERATGQSRARQEQAREQQIRTRTAEALRQARASNNANPFSQRRFLMTEGGDDARERADTGFADRVVPLRPDFRYVAPARASVVTELERHRKEFDSMAAAVMDFALEMIQPTGSSRTQNIKGSERFENERIKQALAFFTSHTKAALIAAYHTQFDQAFDEATKWQLNRRGGDPYNIVQMYPELDVEVHMSCTPIMKLDTLTQLYANGLMNKQTYAEHAFHMFSLPLGDIELREAEIDLVGEDAKRPSQEERQ